MTPRLRWSRTARSLDYSVGYSLPYEVGVSTGSVNDLNQLGSATYQLSRDAADPVFGNDGFFYVRGLFSQQENLADPTNGRRRRQARPDPQNNLSLGVQHQFTPRLFGTVVVNNGVYDTNQFARADVISVGGSGNMQYQLTPHHQLGGGVSYSRQMFNDTFNRPASDTDYYNVFGSWDWLFDETTDFMVQLGPAVIHSRQDAAPTTVNEQFIQFSENTKAGTASVFLNDPANCPTMKTKIGGVVTQQQVLFDNSGRTCPVLETSDPTAVAFITSDSPNPLNAIPYIPGGEPQSVSSDRVTYFANATLTKRWSPNVASSLAYVRQDNGASGIDGGAVLDALTLSNTWRISERWDFSTRADWTQRKSATNGSRIFVIPGTTAVPGLGVLPVATTAQLIQIDSSDSLDTQRWGLAARIAYRLTKNTVDGAPVRLQQAVVERGYGRPGLGFRRPSRDVHGPV